LASLFENHLIIIVYYNRYRFQIKYIETHVTKNIPFEFNRYLAGLDQITKKLWEITMTEKDKVGDQTTTTTTTTTNKDIMAALTLLIQCYNKRLEMLVGGPEST
jgi:hypothetical protein